MEEDEVTVLKETVCHQHLIMQKLYTELEEEREASATAATEALSMILRLQGEKAAEKMEACQYKRVVEEKMRYAEESLVIFEELLYQKEMEIASLKVKVQDYIDKSSDISCDSKNETETSADQLSKGSNSQLRENGFRRYLRRNSSLPILTIKELCSQIGSIEKEIGSVRSTFSIPGCADQSKNELILPPEAVEIHRKLSIMSQRSVNWNYGLDQVEEIKEKVIDSSRVGNLREENMIDSTSADNKPKNAPRVDYENGGEGCLFSTKSLPISFNPCHSIPEEVGIKQTEENLDSSSIPFSKAIPRTDTTASRNTQAIFGVPLHHDALIKCRKLASQNSTLGYELKEERLWSSQDSKFQTPRKEVISSTLQPPTIDIEQFEKRLQKLEEDRVTKIHENFDVGEQMKLLKDIYGQLNLIQSYISDKLIKKEIPPDTSSITSLMEAMLSFSI